MPRQRRLILPGIAAHIIQRGNNHADCFRCESDYLVYLLNLKQLSAKLECAVHAYCLMTNHVHLLLTPPSAEACSALMRDLGQRYVQYFNRRHDRSGTLWEGRFLSSVVGSPEYVMACYRYAELNPVRARMVGGPGDYRWSSHGFNVGQRTDDFLTPHDVYVALGGPRAYEQLFEDGLSETMVREIREAVNGGYPLGNEAFLNTLKPLHSRRLQRGRPGRPSAGARMK